MIFNSETKGFDFFAMLFTSSLQSRYICVHPLPLELSSRRRAKFLAFQGQICLIQNRYITLASLFSFRTFFKQYVFLLWYFFLLSLSPFYFVSFCTFLLHILFFSPQTKLDEPKKSYFIKSFGGRLQCVFIRTTFFCRIRG